LKGSTTRILNASAADFEDYPFKLMRERWPNPLLSATTPAEFGKKMPCGQCRSRDVAYQDAPGLAKSF